MSWDLDACIAGLGIPSQFKALCITKLCRRRTRADAFSFSCWTAKPLHIIGMASVGRQGEARWRGQLRRPAGEEEAQIFILFF